MSRADASEITARIAIVQTGFDGLSELTKREREVLRLISIGRTNRQIAEALVISVTTADRHVHNILRKLGCANRTEAAAVLRRTLRQIGSDPPHFDVMQGAQACPYPGLRAFAAEDAAFFFGRDEVVARLVARLSARPLLTVVGASGSGKTSLVRAGLVPALESGALPGSADWAYAIMTPGVDPFGELAARLSVLGQSQLRDVRQRLERDARGLDEIFRELAAICPPDFRLVLAVDQLEELFTSCHDRAIQRRFIESLTFAALSPSSRVTLILAVRADFYGEFASVPDFAGMLETSHALLASPGRDELRLAIELPAQAVGLQLEAGLSDRILDDVFDSPGALPLLSHALREAWIRREGRTIAVASYLATGGIRGAIAQSAEDAFAGFDDAGRMECRNLFLRMTEAGEGTDDTRRRVKLAEVVSGDQSESTVDVIRRLAEARLVTVGNDFVEMAHEALIREWPRLRIWLDEDREGRRLLRHLADSARSWENLGRDDGELYGTVRLNLIREWEGDLGARLSPLERDFVAASVALRERDARDNARRLRRLRLLAATLAALGVAAGLVGGFALLQWNRANDARDRASVARDGAETARANEAAARQRADDAVTEAILSRLETEIPSLIKSNRSLAFALAVQAYRLQPGARTAALLNLGLGDDPRYLGAVWPSSGTLAGYALSPDGRFVVTRTTDGLVELHQATSLAVMGRVETGATGVFSPMYFLPDGDAMVSSGYDGASHQVHVEVLSVPSLAVARRFEFASPTTTGIGGLTADSEHVGLLVNGELHLLGVRDGSDRTINGTPRLYGSPQFDRQGRYMAAQLTDRPGNVGVFDATTYALLRTVPQWAVVPAPLLFTPAGDLLVVNYGPGSDPGKVELWDPASGERLASLASQQTPGAPAVNAAGTLVALPTAAGRLGILSLPDLKPVTPPLRIASASYPVPAFSPGDTTLYNLNVTAGLDRWDLTGVGLADSYTFAPGAGEAALSHDGTWLVKEAPDGSWTRWSVPGFHLLDQSVGSAGPATTPGTGSSWVGPAISADSRYFATGHADCPHPELAPCGSIVLVWDVKTGQAIGEPIVVPNHTVGLHNPALVVFHPSLALFAIAGQESAIQVWRIEGNSLVPQSAFTTDNGGNTLVNSMAFLPSAVADRPTLVTYGGTDVAIWDVSTSQPSRVGLFDSSFTVRALAVTHAGSIALGRSSGEMQLFHPGAFASALAPQPYAVVPGVVPLGGATASPVGFTFSADDVHFAVRTNGNVAVWDAQSAAWLGTSFAPAGGGTPLLAPDGSFVIVSGDSMTVKWPLDTDLWAAAGCKAAGRNLTGTEWEKYFPGRDYTTACPDWPPAAER